MRRMIVDLSATVASSPDLQMPSIIPQHALGNGRIDSSSAGDANITQYGSSSSMDALVEFERQQLDDDIGGAGAPKHVHGSHVCSLLFLQLAEHLTLRAVRLYQSWKQFSLVCKTAENLRASVLDNVDAV
eukprot:217288-Ditylum_brightwellii.AAC.1